MDLDTDDEVLRVLADGKSIDYDLWPALLSRLIPRLEKIVNEDFPLPAPRSPQPSSSQIPSSPPPPPKKENDPSTTQNTLSSPSSTDKENAPPPPPPTSTVPTPGAHIQTLLTSITSTLTTLFSTHPPHTIQRLAELLLTPTTHYRTLPSYLHAVDRVIHVSSGAHIFPLPPAIPDPSSSTVLSNGSPDPLSVSWGTPSTTPQASLGSDESLGGALLTPIPWLGKSGSRNGTHSPLEGEVKTESTEMIDGPNGMGGIETVSVSVNGIQSTTKEQGNGNLRAEGGVTQGELLRQEQRAGVVPAAQLQGGLRGDSEGMGEVDEAPHARGPEEIGMEDMGPQGASASERIRMGSGSGMQGIDVEAAVGRRGEVKEEGAGTPKREADEEMGNVEKRVKEAEVEGKEEEEEDEMVLVDADGRTEGEKKVGEEGENKGADAVDATTV